MKEYPYNLIKKYLSGSRTLLLIACLTVTQLSWAQEDSDEDGYDSEFVWGVNLNTNGGLIGGVIFRYSQALDEKMYQHFALEIVNVKHPKEFRYQGAGNSFIYFKSNYLFSVRPHYGRELVLFRKAPEEGVRISAIASAGPSIGIIKPYYIEVSYPQSNETFVEQYDPDQHATANILGSTNLLNFNGSQVAVGAHVKGGVTFAFGSFRSSVTGFEVGFMAEGYNRTIILNKRAENRQLFTSLYLNLFFGGRK